MASTPATTVRQRQLRAIQETSFTLYDLMLYLDTHPGDTEALALYDELNMILQAQMKEYSDNFGAITPAFITLQCGYNRNDCPWPWQEG